MRRPEIKIDRKLAYFPWGEDRNYSGDSIHSSFYSSMFYQDMHLGLFPPKSDRKRSWKLIGASEKNIQDSARVFQTKDYGNSYLDAEDIVEDFVEEVIQLLLLEDIVHYEICDISDGAENWQVLGIVPPVRLEIGARVVQKLSADFAEMYPGTPLVRKLEKERFVIFKTPDWVSSGAGFSRTLRFLVEESARSLRGSTYLEDLIGNKRTGYDFKHSKDLNVVAVLKSTNEFGWSGRGMGTEYMTDYYLYLRLMRFKIFQRKLVEFMIQEMNRVLRMACFGTAHLPSIQIEGLASSSDYTEKMLAFEKGTLKFEAVRELVYKS